ncbi:MAG: metal ABC transporter permease [Rhodospirillales bacterium]|nr:metal ABC transporter permease [Rhodospirillales bacterium]
MTLADLLLTPFLEFSFMRRALVGCFALALGAAPVGVFLMLRRMSLMGDVMAHAILPGAAVGFLVAGLSLGAMTAGGLTAGLIVALLAGLVSRVTPLREDASFAAFYLISLAAGVLIVSMRGSSVDLMHILFGTVLALNDAALRLIASIATLTLFAMAAIYRGLVAECFDPGFLRVAGVSGPFVHLIFLALVVLNLVGGFHALGTLMVVGIMMLPAVAARFWASQIWSMILAALLIAVVASYAGLLLSYHANLPSGPAIILMAGGLCGISILAGGRDGVLVRLFRRRHLKA